MYDFLEYEDVSSIFDREVFGEGDRKLLNPDDMYQELELDILNEVEERSLFHLGKDLDTLVKEEVRKKQPYEYIQSVVGDDEITTTNSKLLGLLLIVVGPPVLGIKLSEHDVGICSYMGNYAEEWILTPPSREATWDGIQNRHQNNGVPFVLDGPKLKLLNPTRKDSELEMDLESRVDRVMESASWTNGSWFTKSFHEIGKIVALTVYDFRSCRTFPFLYKSEGGCGGEPPFTNVYTALCTLLHFSRGKASPAVIGIMDEAAQINMGLKSPSNAVYLKAVHAAQTMGPEGVERIDRNIKALGLEEDPVLRRDYLDMIMEKEPIPYELRVHEAFVEPKDYLLGAAVSHLRQLGVVMTELDVRMLLARSGKIKALKGPEPMGLYLKEEAERLKLAKKTAWSLLAVNSETSSEFYRDGLQSMDWIEIMKDYFRMRRDKTLVTGLSYADILKIYPAFVVRDYFMKESLSIREEFISSLPVSREFKMQFRTLKDQQIIRDVDEWIRSDNLQKLIAKPLPPGIGPDDARIMLKIQHIMDVWENRKKPMLFIIISSDKKMRNAITARLNAKYGDRHYILAFMSFEYYLMEFVARKSPRYVDRGRHYVTDLHIRDYTRDGVPVAWPSKMYQKILGGRHPNEWPVRFVIWDFPNINKNFANIVVKGTQVSTIDGGFLDHRTVQALNSQGGYAFLELNEITGMPCFNIREVIVDYTQAWLEVVKNLPWMSKLY